MLARYEDGMIGNHIIGLWGKVSNPSLMAQAEKWRSEIKKRIEGTENVLAASKIMVVGVLVIAFSPLDNSTKLVFCAALSLLALLFFGMAGAARATEFFDEKNAREIVTAFTDDLNELALVLELPYFVFARESSDMLMQRATAAIVAATREVVLKQRIPVAGDPLLYASERRKKVFDTCKKFDLLMYPDYGPYHRLADIELQNTTA